MKWATVLFVVAALAVPARAKISETSLEEFRASIECGYLVEVEDTVAIDAPEQGTGPHLNRVAHLRVEVSFSFGQSSCHAAGDFIDLEFSTEIHSSHPRAGENALVFPVHKDGKPVEAVYGRSYWRLAELHDKRAVEITWRNGFLLAPLEIRSGEVALVSLDSVMRHLGVEIEEEQ